jgi:hypothetical protein
VTPRSLVMVSTDEPATSIFRVSLKMVALRASETLVPTYQTARHLKTEAATPIRYPTTRLNGIITYKTTIHTVCWPHVVPLWPSQLKHHNFLFLWLQQLQGSRDSSVGTATGYGLDGREVGVRVPVRSRMFSSLRRPDRFWGPPSHLSNGYTGLFHRG